MAPNRKKKKPVSNPARGFTTVSIPSKPKATESPDHPDTAPTVESDVPSGAGKSNQSETKQEDTPASQGAPGPGLESFSPAELERHLEEAELQSVIDKYASKCKNDASRQAVKFETERRVLRPQASHLSLRDWLPPEILDQILDMARKQAESLDFSPRRDPGGLKKLPSDEEVCAKLWTLKQTLLKLDIDESKLDGALRHALLYFPYAAASTSRDTVWSLEESLEWLAMYSTSDELPAYANSKPKIARVPDSVALSSSDAYPSSSGTTTPSDNFYKKKEKNSKNHKAISSPVSDDSEDYFDPENLIPEYVSLQSRVYKQQPELFEHGKKQRKKAPEKKAEDSLNPEVAKLRRKMAKIEADVLFDRAEAEQAWNERLEGLRIEMAEEREHREAHKTNDSQKAKAPIEGESEQSQEEKTAEPAETQDPSEENEEGDLFGDIFSSNQEPLFPESAQVSEDKNSTSIIRDFGKWSGLSPRRILEETCRARDSGCKVSYRNISSSTFSNRMAVEIRWSKSQDMPQPIPLSMISFKSDSRLTLISMASISTPTVLQSEAYVSTVALFLLFAHSPKESKAHMRLPAVWRDLWTELSEYKKEHENSLDKEEFRGIQKLLRETTHGFEDDVVLTNNFRKRNGTNDAAEPDVIDVRRKEDSQNSDRLIKLWNEKCSTPSFQKMMRERAKLPISDYRREILDTLAAHQAVIICSETGSGKSTQIPSFILENELLSGRACKVYVTEPRRISAISLARRVSEELGERKNDIGTLSSLVGYAIRLESKISASTRLIFATTGVVVRMLERPKEFQDITHLVLDEVHERTIDGDFLLIVVRRLLQERPNLKLILMSATVDSQRLSKYLDNAPVLNIPGRTFPVEVKYLEDAVELTNYKIDDGQLPADYDSDDDKSTDEATSGKEGPDLTDYSKRTRETITAFNEYHLDYRLITNLVEKIATTPGLDEYSKAILIFMPGLAEIRRLSDEISSLPTFAKDWEIFALHSSIASDEQERAFVVPPKGVRKIVIATNIAETGITIPDITAVIDTGKEKVMRFDERRQLSKLVESFISRANAKQRRGRAGRVQRGLCFHMFTKYRHDKLIAEQQTPEMLRLSLQDLVLRVKICDLGEVEQTLSEAPDPPSSKNIRRAIDALKDVKALTNLESLTPLGRQLAKLPLDVFLGKLIIYGTFFKCLDAAVSIAAILSSKSPFVNTMGSNAQRDLARMSYKKGGSDLLTVYNAYSTWKRIRNSPGVNEYSFCRKSFLSPQGLLNIEDVKMQLLVSIADAGLLKLDSKEKASLNRARFTGRQRQFFEVPERTNINSGNDLIVNSVIAWSFYPKLLVREGKGWRNIANNQAVSLHPTSVNKRPEHPLKWLSFYHIMQARSKFYNAHETSAVEDFAVALLCGDVEFKLYSGVIIIDGNRIRFSVNDWKSMLALKILSNKMRDLLSSTFKNPHKPLSHQQEEWMDIWQRIFSQSASNGT